MLYYKSKEYDDICLWEYFREDFKGWTLDIWTLGSKAIIREFRDFLRENGVYVLKDKALIAMNVQAVLDEEEQHKWTKREIEHQIRTMRKFNSRWNPDEPESPNEPESPDEPESPNKPATSTASTSDFSSILSELLSSLPSTPPHQPVQQARVQDLPEDRASTSTCNTPPEMLLSSLLTLLVQLAPSTSITAPQLEQARDPLALGFNNLLVFSMFFQMPELSIAQQTTTIRKAMAEITNLQAIKQVNNALQTRNGLRTENLHLLLLRPDALAWRIHHKEWGGLYKLNPPDLHPSAKRSYSASTDSSSPLTFVLLHL
jgi:hypothetical protein